jgi:hypothetical protein
LLDAAEGVEVVDLATVDDALAVAGAPPAASGVLSAAVDLAEFVAAVLDLPVTKGATAGMLLICMIANLFSVQDGTYRERYRQGR